MKGFAITNRTCIVACLAILLGLVLGTSAACKPARTTMQGSIDGFKPGKLKKRKILMANEIKVLMLNNGKPEIQDYEVISYTFAIAPKKQGKNGKDPSSYIEMANGPKISDTMKDRIRWLRKGDLVVIGNVYVKMPDGNQVMMSGTTYTIVN